MSNSNKNEEIKTDGQVQLIYSKGGDSEFLSIYGKAQITKDQDKIDELWNGYAKAYFQDGKRDPDISLIKVIPEEGYYWETVHGKCYLL